MHKPIFIAASPNTKYDDVLLAKSLLFRPWTWRAKARIENLQLKMQNYLGIDYVLPVDSARSGIYITLKAMGIGEGDEVILPSFTCLVVANAVRWTGATPVYLDTNKNDFNANYNDGASKITEKTKAILVQHTFGKMVDIEKLRSRITNHKSPIYIIEDIAHTISRNQKLRGDIGVLTFGIEKIISGVRGGAIITKNKNLKTKIEQEIFELPDFPLSKALNALTNPIFWYFTTPLHAVGIGKASVGAGIRWMWRKLGFLGNMIEQVEHDGKKPSWLPTQISPILATLATHQLNKLDAMNAHRQKIAQIYDESLRKYSDYDEFDENRVWLRYPISVQNAEARNRIFKVAKELKIVLGDWYTTPLYSKHVTEQTWSDNCYVPATTPVTLQKCAQAINLPTGPNISKEHAQELVEKIKGQL